MGWPMAFMLSVVSINVTIMYIASIRSDQNKETK